MDDFTVSIDPAQIAQLDTKLKSLSLKMQRTYLRKALKAAGTPMLASAQALAPVSTNEPTPDSTSLPPGALRDDLHMVVSVSTRTGASVKVGPSAATAHVANWQENGWMLTGHKPSKKKIKQIPGKHFLASSFDESADSALAAFTASLEGSLNTVDESDTDETG